MQAVPHKLHARPRTAHSKMVRSAPLPQVHLRAPSVLTPGPTHSPCPQAAAVTCWTQIELFNTYNFHWRKPRHEQTTTRDDTSENLT